MTIDRPLLLEGATKECAGVIGSDIPWLDCPASDASTLVITVTE